MTQTATTLSNSAQTQIVEALNQSLADTVVTTMLAQNFHWNVTGMGFGQLHALFQEVYEDHFAGQDALAERVRSLDGFAEGTLAGMVKRAKVKEHEGKATDVEMLTKMQIAQETLAQSLADAAAVAAEHGDALSEDLCIARGTEHEKFAWMMRAHLK